MFNSASTLIASLIWGSVGVGFFIYGKKQSAMIPLFGGIVMIGISYFVGSALVMSAVCLIQLAVMYWLIQRGF